MALRPLKLQGVAILLGMTLFAAGFVAFDLNPDESLTLAYIVVFVASYFVIFAGAHLYMALRGESGDVPVQSHWRFVGLVALLSGLGLLGWAVGDVKPIAGVDPAFLVGMLALVILVGYATIEAIEGYRAGKST